MQLRLWSGALALCALAGSARAEPLDLSEIEDVEALTLGELLERPVVAASRYAQKPGSSPTLVSSIDAEQIERLGFRTIGEALRGMRGIYVSNDRDYSFIGVRGLSVPGDYNTRIALAVDGHMINDAVYQQAALGAELGVPMIAIDHLEVLRGGAWSVYGHSALLGAVEVVTATGASRPGLRVTTTERLAVETARDPAGRPTLGWRGQDASASYGAVVHGVDVFAAATYLFDPGLARSYTPDLDDPTLPCVTRAAAPRTCDGLVHGNDGEQAGSAYLAVRGRHLALRALVARRHKDVPTASFGSLIDDPGRFDTDQRAFVDAEYRASSARGDVIAHVATDYYGFIGQYPLDLAQPDAEALPASRTINRDYARGLGVSAELRGRYKIPRLGRLISDVELALGGEAGISSAAQRNYDRLLTGVRSDFDLTVQTRMAALSAQASLRIADHVVAFAAVRGDDYPESFGTTVNPQGGLVLDGGELGRLRVSFARGFRAPNPYERYYGTTEEAHAAVGPERSETRELSLERYLGDHVRAQLVGYTQRMTDLITVISTDTEFYAINQNEVHAHGVEAELEGRWDTLRARATYAWQHSSDQDGARLVNSPRSLASALVLAPLWRDRLELGAQAYFVGARRSSAGGEAPAAVIADLAVTARRVAGDLDVTLGVTNLFDDRGGDPGSDDHRQSVLPRDPRIVWLRLQLELGR